MQKKSFSTITLIVLICCITVFLSGCDMNMSGSSEDSTNDVSQTQATPPSNETQTQSSFPTDTSTSSEELQTPGSISPEQNNTSELSSATVLETGLDDGTEVNLIVSGQKLDKHKAVIMGGEVLIPDHPYIFGNLKDSSGIESAGFWSVISSDANVNLESAFISNSQYSLKIVEGEYSLICNEETIPLDIPAQNINGRFMIPLVAIAKSINATVEWDETTQTISFFY